ncbi:SAM-dependent methyltransferase [Candidatus Entotheonella palauensis]|uniref:SAM-dependent methyltransferase n=1 Tax=Candidatus Entotheonella gemina TaxID=1429439 RepID=W4LKY7_9BACT|nr:SAM-dependent methyltransferase [Candidatus Entotheonella palauensis]ETW98355.1 MAG: hypothetical protein ETSY2_42975 [Candidatus Entotheonella gemina]
MNANDAQTGSTAMKGGGYYSLSTVGAKDVIDGAGDLVIRALEAHLQSGNGKDAFTIADMGCADGGTSLDMIHRVVGQVRKHDPQRPIRLIYEDQPTNDYNALFQNVRATQPDGNSLATMPDVYWYAAPVSFYEQVLPAGTLNLGFSATAMHWLSAKPCEISNHVQAVGAQGRELEAFAEQGRKDWERILSCRASELAPEGRMIIVNFCRDESGQYLGNTGGINMFDIFRNLWENFVREDVITADEFERMTLPQYYNCVEEFKAPFEAPDGVAHLAGLRLEHIETRVVPCPYAARFHSGEWDAPTFAHFYIPTLRSWTESTFFSGLSESRPAEDRHAIIERYYNAYEALVAHEPEQHSMDYVHAYMVIRKVG